MNRRKRRRDRARHMEATQARKVIREVRRFRRLVSIDPGWDWVTLNKLAEHVGGVLLEDGTLLPLLVPHRFYEDIGDFDRAVLATGIPEFARMPPGADPFGHGPSIHVRRRPGWEPDGTGGRVVVLNRPNGDQEPPER
jgi:hypothetical protein